MDEQSIKSIARPIRVYALRPERSRGADGKRVVHRFKFSARRCATPVDCRVAPDKLRDDREQQYFADEIPEDLTTDLFRLEICSCPHGCALCAERKCQAVGLNPQLIDAASDAHLWTERFNGDTSYLFTLEDEITSRIAAALNLELIGAEAARPTEHLDALYYILRARAAVSTYAEAIRLYERAMALDPRSVAAQSWAVTLGSRVINQLTDTDAADIARAEGLVEQALAMSPRSTTAHFARGEVLWAQRRYSEGIHEHETMLAFDRNSVSALVALGTAS